MKLILLKTFFLLLIFGLLVVVNCKKNAVITFVKTFGGPNWEEGYSVQPTLDSGYIIVGMTYSFGAGKDDVYLIKIDAKGNQQWFKTFGGSRWDYGSSVQPTADGGYIIVGSTASYGAGDYDAYLIKTDANGNQKWFKTFGGQYEDEAKDIQPTKDGGYIIVGTTKSYGAGKGDIYLIKIDAKGNQQWFKTFGSERHEYGASVQPTPDSGYIILGGSVSFGSGNDDLYLIKTDKNGNQEWFKTFGGAKGEYSASIRPTADGGYIIVGSTESYGAGGVDIYLIKTDANGNQQWFKTFGGRDWEYGYSVQPTVDGGYIIVGMTYSFGAGFEDVYLIKTDANGNEQWFRTFGGRRGDAGSSVRPTADGGYIIVGRTKSYGAGVCDIYLIKTDRKGNIR